MTSEAGPYEAIARMVATIGQPECPALLAQFLRKVADFDFLVIFGYRGSARPQDLYDDFPASKRRVFVTDYQEGPYLLDPFFLASREPVKAGLYRMRDLAPDRFYQGEYFRSYYVQTGLAEEAGFFVDLPDSAMVVVSMMRAERPFGTREFRALEEVRPLVETIVRRNWPTLGDLAAAGQDGQPLQDRVAQSFQSFGGGLLTAREREIAEFTLKGHSAEAIGRIFGISPGTVRIHRRNIYAKLRISSQGELFSTFIQTLTRP
jgi:DNA-binding CsgD family transcriptional regulator